MAYRRTELYLILSICPRSGVQRRRNCSRCKKCGGVRSRKNPRQGGPSAEDQDEIDVPDHLVQECLDSMAAEDAGLGLQRQKVSNGSSLVGGLGAPAVSWTPTGGQPLQAAQPKPAAAPLAAQQLPRPPSWPSSSVRLKSILRRSVAPVPQSRGGPVPPEASHQGELRVLPEHQSRAAQAAPSSAAALATNEGARGVGASSPSGSDTARKPRPRKSRSPPGSRAALATRLTATVPLVDENRELRCTDCNILFQSGKMLVAHLRTHNKERPFKCDQCEATFTEGWTLKYHKFRHTGLKPFQCPVCSRKFRTRDALRQHVAGQHTNEARHACPHCQKKFRYRAEFHRHKAVCT